ncbi:hypothetical protein [Pseudonocardia sp. ICBG1293]|uniref:hypothetical protein n=1 Tax=Pseudonocardia sp. ICBG1293 TaxID=2844382 RepID=UPI001CCE4A87|nr:hypothetical protein [Pseudonocardia sp. ICBG1293]
MIATSWYGRVAVVTLDRPGPAPLTTGCPTRVLDAAVEACRADDDVAEGRLSRTENRSGVPREMSA